MSVLRYRQGCIHFFGEGYELHWSEEALTITAVEYETSPLQVPWELLLGLAKKAGALRPPPDEVPEEGEQAEGEDDE